MLTIIELKCISGIGLGVSTTVATVYTMEIATPNMRGRLAVIPAIGKFQKTQNGGYLTGNLNQAS